MNSPERPQPERLQPLERGKWEALLERLATKEATARRLGVDVNYLVMDAANRWNHYGKGVDSPLFGASVGKLGLAKMAIDYDLPEQQVVSWAPERRDTTGGGKFDKEGGSTTATVGELIEDMLMRSGNTPVRVLSPLLGDTDEINHYYESRLYDVTRVGDAGEGKIFLGPTTPHESIKMLDALLLGPINSSLHERARRALVKSEVRDHGIRKQLSRKLQSKLLIANKTGDYPGDDDDDYAVVHDVGYVQNNKQQRLKYAIMTQATRMDEGSAKGRLGRFIADQKVSQMGAELAYTLGGRPIFPLGARALRY